MKGRKSRRILWKEVQRTPRAIRQHEGLIEGTEIRQKKRKEIKVTSGKGRGQEKGNNRGSEQKSLAAAHEGEKSEAERGDPERRTRKNLGEAKENFLRIKTQCSGTYNYRGISPRSSRTLFKGKKRKAESARSAYHLLTVKISSPARREKRGKRRENKRKKKNFKSIDLNAQATNCQTTKPL